MKEDCNYDKTKLLHELASLKHFIRRHAIEDARKANHPHCESMYAEVAEDIDNALKKLKSAVSGLAKEGKYD